MPYYVQTLRPVPVDRWHPVGVAVDTRGFPTLADAVAAEGTTGAIFTDEITYGRTMIRNDAGEWVNDYANPARQPSGQVTPRPGGRSQWEINETSLPG